MNKEELENKQAPEVPANETPPAEEAPKEGTPVEEGAETPPEEAAEPKQAEPSAEEQLRKHLKVGDGEDLHAKALSHIKELGEYKKQNDAVNQKLIEAFDQHPELAAMVKDVVNGAPVNVAIARNIDVDALKPGEGDDDEEEWNKALEQRKKTKAEKEAYLKELDDNIKMSRKELDAFAKENNISDDKAEDFLKNVDELVSNMVRGKVTKEALNVFYKGLQHDNDVQDAAKVGEVKGKNAKIEAIKAKEDAVKGDGLPKLASQNETKPKPKEEVDPWSEAIQRRVKRRNL